jgi:tetraacyldisaccharide 4'-kinase
VSAPAARAPGVAGLVEEIWYGNSAAAAAGRMALLPLSMAHAAALALRPAPSAQRAPKPVLSVGSLRVGGAGKTPFVLWLATRLAQRGVRPCIVTGGYGGSEYGRSMALLGLDTAREPEAAGRFGDEAVLLALRSRLPVAVGRNRLAACRAAADAVQPDVFVLDDGFQHRALARDLDILLVAGTESGEWLLPAGPLREPASAASRADVVTTPRARAEAVVADVGTPIGDSPRMLAGRRVVAVAAIARPGRFVAELERAGAVVTKALLRRDHHRFGDSDRVEIERAAAGNDLVVTTEKDLVKLARLGIGADLRALRIEVDVDDGDAIVARAAALAGV